jgi:hypothetical protein
VRLTPEQQRKVLESLKEPLTEKTETEEEEEHLSTKEQFSFGQTIVIENSPEDSNSPNSAQNKKDKNVPISQPQSNSSIVCP